MKKDRRRAGLCRVRFGVENLCCFGGGCGDSFDDAKLPHHPVDVVVFYVLDQFTAFETANDDALDGDALARGRNAHEFALMSATACPSRHDGVALRDLLITCQYHVRKCVAVHGDKRLVTIASAHFSECRFVVGVVAGDDFIERPEISFVDDLFDYSPCESLICVRHSSSIFLVFCRCSRRYPGIRSGIASWLGGPELCARGKVGCKSVMSA